MLLGFLKNILHLLVPQNEKQQYTLFEKLYLKDKQTIKKVGIIDFQDALIGSNAYDLVSLLEDVRRPISLVLKEITKGDGGRQSSPSREPAR